MDIRGEQDILEVFKKYKNKLLQAVKVALKKHQLKMDIVICVKMFRVDKDGNKEDTTLHFRGGARLILRESDFDGALKKIGSGGFACATRGGFAMRSWPLLVPTSGLFSLFSLPSSLFSIFCF